MGGAEAMQTSLVTVPYASVEPDACVASTMRYTVKPPSVDSPFFDTGAVERRQRRCDCSHPSCRGRLIIIRSRMPMRSRTAALLCGLLVACSPRGEREPQRAQAARPLTVSTTERGPLLDFDADSAGGAAHITHLVPEGDGDGIAFTFADSQQHVAAALGLIDRQRVHARLAWPDSVAVIWWPKLHQLAFSSAADSNTSYLIADAHAPELQVARDSGGLPLEQSMAAPQAAHPAARARASAYIDSVHLQLGGRGEHSLLRYFVADVVMAPGDSLAAFYAVATDSSGARFNPSWYVLDPRSGQIAPVDRLVGHVDAMPMQVATWDSVTHFFYVKERTLYEVHVAR